VPAGFEHGDGPGARREKLQAFLASTETSARDVALLMDLLSIGTDDASLDLSPHRKKQSTLEALLRQLEALARQQLLLVIFEDLHWIDPTSRELIDHIVNRVQRLPVLLLLTYRTEFEAAWSGRPHVTTAALSRLARRERHGDAAAIVMGHRMMGVSSLFSGNLTSALDHLGRTLALYKPAYSMSPILQGASRPGCSRAVSSRWSCCGKATPTAHWHAAPRRSLQHTI